MAEGRVYIDCREYPSVNNCSLYIAGKPDEVLAVAVQHAISSHEHADTPELPEMLRGAMKPEAAAVAT